MDPDLLDTDLPEIALEFECQSGKFNNNTSNNSIFFIERII